MQYYYTARSHAGDLQSGTVEAGSEKEAVELLQTHGLVVIALEEESKNLFGRELTFLNRVKSKELVVFCRQVSILFSAKVPLVETLHTVAKQIRNRYFREIILEISNDVEGGTVFSKALAKHPKVFSSFFISMVRSGEVSGTLEMTLNYLADYLEKQYYINSKVRGAMVYPAFILGGFIIVAVLMLTMVVPKLVDMIMEIGAEGAKLPLPTRILIGTSNFAQNYGLIVLAFIILGLSALWYYIAKYPEGRRMWHATILRTPIIGKQILLKLYLSRLSDNLSTLIKGGISILNALQISADVVGNVIFKEILLEAREQVRVGGAISSVFERRDDIIPPMVARMVNTGEKTGSLDIILKKMADFYAKEMEVTTSTLSQLIEPILIVILGAGVAILVSAILMPIYNIATTSL